MHDGPGPSIELVPLHELGTVDLTERDGQLLTLREQPPSALPAAFDPSEARALLLKHRGNDWVHRLPAAVVDLSEGDSTVDSISAHDLAAMAYRIAFRLTGSAARAADLAVEAVESLRPGVGPSAEAVVARSILRTVIGERGSTELTYYNDDDVYRAHRLRLRRDLGRWSRDDQVAIALRHLTGRSVAHVSALVKRTERSVRHATSSWVPSDAATGSETMLSGLGQWAPDPADPTALLGLADHLVHLDDPDTPFDLGGSAT